MTACPTNQSLQKQDMSASVFMPALALISLFQIKACKERWDARCTRGAPKRRCAAARDQIKMKITQFGLILWDGSSGPVKRCSSIDNQVELQAGRLCQCSLLWDSVWIKPATARIVLKPQKKKKKKRSEYQTQAPPGRQRTRERTNNKCN